MPNHKTNQRCLAVILLVFLFLSLCSCEISEPDFVLDILDVGKADCSVLQIGNHVTVIDCGEEENLSEILAFLDQNNIRKIDCLILSHFDKDHIGGVSGILNAVEVTAVWESAFPSDRPEYEEYHRLISEKNISLNTLKHDASFSVNGFDFKIMVPQKESYENKQDNNASLVVSVRKGDLGMLFCGDAMEDRIQEFADETLPKHALVKIPYHGNYLENLEDLLNLSACEIGIITCSKKNPADEKTLSLLNRCGVEHYRTQFGSIRVTARNHQFHILQYA